METGVTIANPGPTSGSCGGAFDIQTPSRAEHGPEGVFFCEVTKTTISGISPIWESGHER